LTVSLDKAICLLQAAIADVLAWIRPIALPQELLGFLQYIMKILAGTDNLSYFLWSSIVVIEVILTDMSRFRDALLYLGDIHTYRVVHDDGQVPRSNYQKVLMTEQAKIS